MGLRSISINLDSTRLSDLFFNFEHPNYDKVYKAAESGQKVQKISIDPAELNEALLQDAMEFTGILGFDGKYRMEISAELVADFERRV